MKLFQHRSTTKCKIRYFHYFVKLIICFYDFFYLNYFTVKFVQLCNFIFDISELGVSEFVLSDITVETARFNLDGVLLNEKARPTCNTFF